MNNNMALLSGSHVILRTAELKQPKWYPQGVRRYSLAYDGLPFTSDRGCDADEWLIRSHRYCHFQTK